MTTDSSPADAFEALRREVALLRRALEGLAAEQKAQPDYSGVLAGIGARIREQNAALGTMAETPALQLTPEAIGQQIMRASQQVRAEDARLLGHAKNGMMGATRQIEVVVETAKNARQQKHAQMWAAVVGFVLGVIIASTARMLIGYQPEQDQTQSNSVSRTKEKTNSTNNLSKNRDVNLTHHLLRGSEACMGLALPHSLRGFFSAHGRTNPIISGFYFTALLTSKDCRSRGERFPISIWSPTLRVIRSNAVVNGPL